VGSANVPAEIIPTPKADNVHLVARIRGTTSAVPLLLLGHRSYGSRWLAANHWDKINAGTGAHRGRLVPRPAGPRDANADHGDPTGTS
jgi:hypothetical protein